MANTSRQFSDFDKKIKLTAVKRDELEDNRTAIEKRIKNHFREEKIGTQPNFYPKDRSQSGPRSTLFQLTMNMTWMTE